LNETDVALTQVVSQMTGPSLPTLSEDLIQTPRMTIEDLIEATEVLVLYYSTKDFTPLSSSVHKSVLINMNIN